MQITETLPSSAPLKNEAAIINISRFYREMVQLITSFGKDEIVSPQKCQSSDEKKIISSTTFWRWDEQLLQELPQRNLIENVFTRVFNSNSVGIWKENLKGELGKYVNITYPSSFAIINSNLLENPSIYDSYIISTLSCKSGINKNTLTKNICIIRYFLDEKEICAPLNQEKIDSIILLFKDFAVKHIEKFIKDGFIHEDNNRYSFVQDNIHVPSLKHATNLRKLEALKIKIVGLSDPCNMFLGFNFSLSEQDMYEFMVEIKKTVSKFSKKLELKESCESNSKSVLFNISTWNLDFSEHILCQDDKMELMQ